MTTTIETASNSITNLISCLIKEGHMKKLKTVVNILDVWVEIINSVNDLLRRQFYVNPSSIRSHFLLIIANIIFNEDPHQSLENLTDVGYKNFIKHLKTQAPVHSSFDQQFNIVVKNLKSYKISKDMFYSSVLTVIKNLIIAKCIKRDGKKKKLCLNELIEWTNQRPLKFLKYIINGIDSNTDDSRQLEQFETQILQFLHRCFFLLKMKNILIMIQTPEDEIALKQLDLCIPYIDKNKLIDEMQKHVISKLANVAYSTVDFITIFILISNLCNNWDSSGELFELVSKDLKLYLKTRTDLIPCLVKKVTSECNSIQIPQDEAYENLKTDSVDDIDEEDKNQLDANSGDEELRERINSKCKTSILTSILQVYGTSTAFLDEYCSQLAMRLLSMTSKEELIFENQQIESIQKYFGTAQTQKCIIMMNDFKKSVEINQIIFNNNKILKHSPIQLEVQLITPLIWDIPPANTNDRFNIPDEISNLVNHYENEFKAHKEMRQVEWLNHLSMVELEIQWQDTLHTFWCSAFYAILLEQFSNEAICNIEELVSKLGASYDKIRGGLIYWSKKGLLMSTDVKKESYQLVKSYEMNQNTSVGNNNNNIHRENNDNLAELKTHEEKVMEELDNETWPFIEGMLTNLGSMGVDKIYSSLKMFAFNHKDPSFTIEQLKNYLNSKVKSMQLYFEHNNYTIRNNN